MFKIVFLFGSKYDIIRERLWGNFENYSYWGKLCNLQSDRTWLRKVRSLFTEASSQSTQTDFSLIHILTKSVVWGREAGREQGGSCPGLTLQIVLHWFLVYTRVQRSFFICPTSSIKSGHLLVTPVTYWGNATRSNSGKLWGLRSEAPYLSTHPKAISIWDRTESKLQQHILMKSRVRGNVTFLLVTENISEFEDYRENHRMVSGHLHTTSSETVDISTDSSWFYIFSF